MLLQSPWVLPEQVCQGRCGETGCAHCGQHSRPSAFPRQRYRSCHVHRNFPGFGHGELSQQLRALFSPTSTSLDAHDHQFAASSCQLWVSRLFVFPGLNQDCPIGVCCSRVRFACTCQRGSQCDVNRQLGPRVTWEILCQHLNASTISGWDTHVHVPQKRVERHSCPCLPAYASQHTFNWGGTFLQTSTAWTCGSMGREHQVELDTPRTQPQ